MLFFIHLCCCVLLHYFTPWYNEFSFMLEIIAVRCDNQSKSLKIQIKKVNQSHNNNMNYVKRCAACGSYSIFTRKHTHINIYTYIYIYIYACSYLADKHQRRLARSMAPVGHLRSQPFMQLPQQMPQWQSKHTSCKRQCPQLQLKPIPWHTVGARQSAIQPVPLFVMLLICPQLCKHVYACVCVGVFATPTLLHVHATLCLIRVCIYNCIYLHSLMQLLLLLLS